MKADNKLSLFHNLIAKGQSLFEKFLPSPKSQTVISDEVVKKNINDSTMIQGSEQSFANSLPSSISLFSQSRVLQRQEQQQIFQSLFGQKQKKSHQKIVYYNSDLQEEYPTQQFLVKFGKIEAKRRLKRDILFQGQDYKHCPTKKIVTNQRVATSVKNSFNELEGLNNYRKETTIQENDFFPMKIKVIKPDEIIVQKNKELVHWTDLPDGGSYSINYSVQDLENMDYKQLNYVSNVKISNEAGSIYFLQPISLFRKDIYKALKISQKQIQIYDQEWRDKQIEFTFKNFDNFANKTTIQKRKVKHLIRQFSIKSMTRVVYFNEFSGDLTLRCERKPINDI